MSDETIEECYVRPVDISTVHACQRPARREPRVIALDSQHHRLRPRPGCCQKARLRRSAAGSNLDSGTSGTGPPT